MTDPDVADSNQADTMHADAPNGGLVIVIDDTIRQGSTVKEATRALREGGAAAVASVALLKDHTGTRQFHCPDCESIEEALITTGE